MPSQHDLFPPPQDAAPAPPRFPPGFRYAPDLVDASDEAALLERLRELPFREFEFHPYTGKRRVVSFGWRYDFGGRTLDRADDIPAFLLPLRGVAGAFAGLDAERLQHVLVTEYGPGAGIGWHRDKAVFGEVIGISLLAPCVLRLRRRAGTGWDRAKLALAPRSAYLFSGSARTEWEHSIPPVASLRYSITFRNLRDDRG